MKEESVNKRKVQAANTKRKIFEAASRLVNLHGVENVSVDSIVEAAGISKGAFYVHYKSKDSLIVDLVNEYTNTADRDYKSFLMSLHDHTCSVDILIILAERVAAYVEHNIGLENMKVLYKSHLTKSIDTTSAMDYSRELYKIFTEIVEDGVKDGELRADISVESIAKHLIMAIRGVVFEWCIRYPDFDLKEQLLGHFKLFLYGVKK